MSAVSFKTPSDLLLALGGTEERLQLVLGEPADKGYSLLASRQWTVPGQSVRFLVPGLEETLRAFGLETDAITRIAVVRGPGSFTGMRLVLAAAQGLAAGNGAQLAGIDYLPLLANCVAPLIQGPLHVLTYARRGLVYSQSFQAPTGAPLAPLAALSLDAAAERIRALGETGTILGSGIRKNQPFFTTLAEACPGLTLLPSQWDNPSPEQLLQVAQNAEFSAMPIEPVYVRASDAEDNLDAIAAKRGLDPKEARRRLNTLQGK